MMNRSFAAASRKRMLRRARALLRLRHDGVKPSAGQPDYLAGLSDAEREELGEIHSALERIERGIYGRCESCFGDVEIERIDAQPTVSDCQKCASLPEVAEVADVAEVVAPVAAP